MSYFATGVQRGASIGGVLNAPKKLADGPMNMALYKKNLKVTSTPMN